MSLSGIMNVIPGWKWISGSIGVIFIALIGWWGLKTFVFLPTDFHEADRRAFEAAAQDLVTQISATLSKANRQFATLALVPVHGDTTNKEGQRRLAERLDNDPTLHLATEGVVGELGATFREWAFGTKASDSAASLLKSKGELDAVLMVSIAARDQLEGFARVRLESELWSWSTKADGSRDQPTKTLLQATGRINLQTLAPPGETPEPSWFSSLWAFLWRALVAMIGAAAIPFAWLPLTDWVMKKGHNWLGMAFLALVVASSLLPWFIVFIGSATYEAGSGTWIFGLLLTLTCAAYAYNLHDAWTERI